MNKFLVYTVIAILLGTVTMGMPIAVLESYNSNLDSDSQVTFSDSNGGSMQRNDSSDPSKVPPFSPEPAPSGTESADSNLGEISALSGLSSIGLMIIPSFVIALGAFAYLRKRII